ncbi:hypothetical protein LUZ60_008390 [Juncus effusus]|nr:hypothetical protein LUZ60_008390 [Juncus effusus]
MEIIPESWERLWNAQEIRILVLASLIFQILLIFLAPLRKRTANKFLILLLWSFYLFADYVAILALGNLLKNQADDNHTDDIMAFWAPFLLLHLGGPDTITSYSIEDNELWWRHLLGLAFQVVVAFLVLLNLFAIRRLRIAASLVFVVGFVKYAERTWALRSSSMDQLRESMVGEPDPGPDYAKFMDEYAWRKEAGQSAYVKGKNEPPPPPQKPSNVDGSGKIYDVQQISEAYQLFKRFKPLVVDLMLSFQDRKYSQDYFWKCNVLQAWKAVEIELSFLYDILHTKAIHIRCLKGCIWRLISIAVIAICLLLFIHSEKQGYKNPDIIISYVLLGTALFLEVTSFLLIIISDWMIVTLQQNKSFNGIVNVIARMMGCVFPKGKPQWSNAMRQYSLLSLSLEDKPTKFKGILHSIKVKDLWDNFWFVNRVIVPDTLKELLFKEVTDKTFTAQDSFGFKGLRDCRGEGVLEKEGCNHLMWSMVREFDESLLLWHIATDICFHTSTIDTGKESIDENCDIRQRRAKCADYLLNLCFKTVRDCNSDCEISLVISNYMIYLLIMQPSMMPAGIGKIRFQDTCAEAKVFFRAQQKGLTKAEARGALLDVDTEVDPREVKGDRSKSMLFDACRLAKELNVLTEDNRWKLISKVWVEMLGYAAINCKTYYHAKQLSMGGELLTHVWLLMAHMGIGEQYRIEAGSAIAKLAFSS